YWSLMAEVSESSVSPVDGASVAEEVIRGMKATGLVPERAAPVTLWHYRSEYGNPTPSIGRDEIVDAALDYLESKGVYSRGRFGAWKYEVSNMDHSVMQGVELVDRLVTGRAETTLPVGRN
ncbi:MAG TPA: amine oxidase, partial [Nitrospirota bacterium]